MAIKFLAVATVIALSGCSATSALTGLVGSKPEVTAQVGAENVKQAVGITAKQEQKNETAIDRSNVGKVDTSTKKTESIKANTIQAERIEVNNGSNDVTLWFAFGFISSWIIMSLILFFTKRKKAP